MSVFYIKPLNQSISQTDEVAFKKGDHMELVDKGDAIDWWTVKYLVTRGSVTHRVTTLPLTTTDPNLKTIGSRLTDARPISNCYSSGHCQRILQYIPAHFISSGTLWSDSSCKKISQSCCLDWVVDLSIQVTIMLSMDICSTLHNEARIKLQFYIILNLGVVW